MKKTAFLFLLSYLCAFPQYPFFYSMEGSSSKGLSEEEKFVLEHFPTVGMADWLPGMEFMVSSNPRMGLGSWELVGPKRAKNRIEIDLEDFSGKVFTLQEVAEKVVECPRGRCDVVGFTFSCEGRLYEYKTFGTLEELREQQASEIEPPPAIDGLVCMGDMYKAQKLLVGKTLSYNSLPVKITEVGMGSEYAPVKITFQYEDGLPDHCLARFSRTNLPDMGLALGQITSDRVWFYELFSFKLPKPIKPYVPKPEVKVMRIGYGSTLDFKTQYIDLEAIVSESSQAFDSTHNFVHPDNGVSCIGQDFILYKQPTSNFDTDKRFHCIGFLPGSSNSSLCYFQLVDRQSRDTLYLECGVLSNVSRFVVVSSYLERKKSEYLNKKFIFKNKFVEGDAKTGEVWTCTGVERAHLIFKSGKGVSMEKGLGFLDDNPHAAFPLEEANRLKRKFGTANFNLILEGKVSIGMTDEMCELSWGKPDDINRTIGSWGVHEQWVYPGGNYLYLENGELVTIQN